MESPSFQIYRVEIDKIKGNLYIHCLLLADNLGAFLIIIPGKEKE